MSTADTWALPTKQTFYSENGRFAVTIEPKRLKGQLEYFQDKVEGRPDAGAQEGVPNNQPRALVHAVGPGGRLRRVAKFELASAGRLAVLRSSRRHGVRAVVRQPSDMTVSSRHADLVLVRDGVEALMRGIAAVHLALCSAVVLVMSVPSAGALDGIDKGGGTLIEELRQKVKATGWQVILISGEGGDAGFLFTIGLWQSHNHPEILLFSPSSDPRDVGGSIQRLVERVRAGERFAPGKRHDGLFNQFPGRFREIDRRWYPVFLGTAGGYYDNFDFPALQLFWPDRAGRFPWESEFDRSLFSLQPILSERNLVLANLPDGTLSFIEENDGIGMFKAAIDELLVKVDAQPAELLEEWRWRIGEEAAYVGTTVFGDLIIQEPDGAVFFLDTGRGSYFQILDSRIGWLRAMASKPEELLHAPLLLDLRSSGYELAPGEVYDFRQEPMIGGVESIDNVQKIPAHVHISHSGRLAMAIKDLPGGIPIEGFEFTPVSPRGPEADDATIFNVVINAEEQYSIWPVGQEIPAGWRSVGKSGTREQCMAYIAEVWTDMRPLSLRQKIDARGEGQ